MNKNYLLIFALAALLSTNVYGQTNYTEGYIVKTNGDTVRGYLDARSDAKNARSIDFKTSLPDKAITYEPTDLATYYLSTGKYYRSKTVTLLDINSIAIKKKTFLEVLEQGKATLYYFVNNVDDIHYYIEKDTFFYELTNDKKIMVGEDGVSRIFYNKRYLNIMNLYFSDCPAWNTKPDYEFTEYGLKKAFRVYNYCGGSNGKQDKSTAPPKEKVTVGYSAYIGANISTVDVPPYISILNDPNTRILPSLGLAISCLFPRINKNVSFQLGLNYNHKGAYSQTNDGKFNLHYLDVEVLIRYTYPKGPIRPFIGAGGIFGYLLNNQSAFIYDDGHSLDNILLSEIELGYCLETGVFVPFKGKQKGLIFAFRYEQTNIPISIGTYENRIFQFKVGYKFK